jgi:hypothetical protein
MFALVPFFCLLVLLGFVLYLFRQDKPLLQYSNAHWHQSIDGLSGTATEFYRNVQALVSRLVLPGINIRKVSFHEGGVLSDKREYLRIRRGPHVFDLCVASFGRGLFVSCWQSEQPSTFLGYLARVPILGWAAPIWTRLFAPQTYYAVDSALMFQEAVHACVLHVLDEMATTQGVPPLPNEARKLAARDPYRRKGRTAVAA